MRLDPTDVAVPTLVLVGLALALVATVGYGAATSDAAFGVANPSWEGTTELRDEADRAGAEVVVATDAERFDAVEANGTVAFVLAPGERTAAERRALRGFVERGGTAVVATRDPGHGNDLLAALGTDVRVDGAILRDEREHLHGPEFPVVASAAEHPAVDGIEGLSLDRGTALVAEGDARPLANSSEFSYLDRDGDGEPDDDETLAARPVVAVQPVGEGDVVAVSDPSAFINALLEHEPNRQFARNLVADADRVVLDRTDDGVPPLLAAVGWLRGTPAGPALLGVVLVGLLVAWERRLHEGAGRRWAVALGRVLGGVMGRGGKRRDHERGE